jgi:hypothetical protein
MNFTVQTSTAVPNRFIALDGSDPAAALKAGLEITGICVVGIAVILTIYYTSLRILSACFPPKPETPEEDD